MDKPIHTPRHGGDLEGATRAFGAPDGGWLDLSTCVNPRPYPVDGVDLAATAVRFPGVNALRNLEVAARRYYGLAEQASLLAVPGSELAIRLIPRVIPRRKVAILSPTYSSHAEAWGGSSAEVVHVDGVEHIPIDADAMVLANPNNPDGRVTGQSALAGTAEVMAARGGLLVIDEAYADVDPTVSFVPSADDRLVLVLRSFGKFFGLPGLRLGFVAGHTETVDGLRQLLGDWPVSALAVEIGHKALCDTAWQEQTRTVLAESATELEALLSRHGLEVAGGTALFRLVAHPDAPRIYEALARQGILTRLIDDRHIRLGLPGEQANLDRLESALASILA